MAPSIAATLLTFLLSTSPLSTAYTLLEDLSGPSFLSGFNFFSGPDPTKGFVRYLNESDALAQGLFSVTESSVYIGVDSTNPAPNGRASVRLESKKLYHHGLFILDLEHMPASTCGTWPAFWMFGAEKEWPVNGEIDIIEGIHTTTTNHMSLHTTDNCSVTGTDQLGTSHTKDCFIHAPGQTANAGCGVSSSSSRSFGTPFNEDGGGVWAVEWTSTSLQTHFFPRHSIPSDILSNTPDPSTWGLPQANFDGECDFDAHFGRQRIVIDTTFCGEWAGAVWGSTAECGDKAATCEEWVDRNPGAFGESFWKVRGLRIFGVGSGEGLIGL